MGVGRFGQSFDNLMQAFLVRLADNLACTFTSTGQVYCHYPLMTW